MNHINNQLVIGAPHSKARYAYATRICADCFQSEPVPQTPYATLMCAAASLIIPNTTCYVCERAHVPCAAVRRVEQTG